MPTDPQTGKQLPYPGDAPGEGAGSALGASPPVAADGFASDPTDPSGAVGIDPMAQMSGPSVAMAIQEALAQRQMMLQMQQQQEAADLLMQDLTEADAMITSLMQGVIGPEATTLDGPGAIPAGMPEGMEELPGPPGLGGGMGGPPGAPVLGAPSLPPSGGAPAAAGGMAGLPPELANLPPEELMALLNSPVG